MHQLKLMELRLYHFNFIICLIVYVFTHKYQNLSLPLRTAQLFSHTVQSFLIYQYIKQFSKINLQYNKFLSNKNHMSRFKFHLI